MLKLAGLLPVSKNVFVVKVLFYFSLFPSCLIPIRIPWESWREILNEPEVASDIDWKHPQPELAKQSRNKIESELGPVKRLRTPSKQCKTFIWIGAGFFLKRKWRRRRTCARSTEKEEEKNIWRRMIFGPRRRLNKQHNITSSHIQLIAWNKRFNSVGRRHKPRYSHSNKVIT